MAPPGMSGGGELGAMYMGRAKRPVLLTTAGAGFVAGATWVAAAGAVVGGGAAAAVVGATGGLVGLAGAAVGAAAGAVPDVDGLPQAANSVAPMAPASVLPPKRSISERRVSLAILILRQSKPAA